jgi:hypothetical protein
MSSNPLQQYFRQPKIYIRLPSDGTFNKPGSIQGDLTNLPVYGMTGMDEIIIKTPDALMSGESTVKVIESCCPSIKDGWDLSILDTELIFTAIRIATYGNMMGVSHTCPGCQTENDYDVDLSVIVDHLSNCQYQNKVVLDELILKIQPLNYLQSTNINVKNFELQRQLFQTDAMEDETEKQASIDNLWKKLAEIQNDVYFASVESIETPTVAVTEKNYIIEYLKNCDKSIFDAIKSQIDANRDNWKFPGYPVKCTTCGNETNLTLDLDPSNFFVQA